ncbi:hypothetical protein [Microvenator marinus]|jgi:predicted LPLAT superfamily acyltransferase|nr:hypothetical protein [Microvenator marinus]
MSGTSRRAITEFYQRLNGSRPRRRDVFRNIHRFSQVALDRVFFFVGKTSAFEFKRTGSHHLAEQSAKGTGGVLIGAHLGSFAAMSGAGETKNYRINAVMYNANSKVLNSVLQRFGGKDAIRTIDISTDRVSAVLTMKKRIEEGEFVALLADRVVPGSQSSRVDFLGGSAKISTGGFVLASVLKCPVFLVFGLYRGGNKYDVYCEPFEELIRLPRGKEKQEVLDQLAQKYADRLAYYAAKAPDNWFNFYSFWEPDTTGTLEGEK